MTHSERSDSLVSGSSVINTKRVRYAVEFAHTGPMKGLASSAAFEQSGSQVSLLSVGSAFSPQRAAKQRGTDVATVSLIVLRVFVP
jgi:hypothetical protein